MAGAVVTALVVSGASVAGDASFEEEDALCDAEAEESAEEETDGGAEVLVAEVDEVVGEVPVEVDGVVDVVEDVEDPPVVTELRRLLTRSSVDTSATVLMAV